MTEKFENPDARLKITRSGKGVLILVPVPVLGGTLAFVTSKSYLQMLLDGTLKHNMLGCQFLNLNEGVAQFMTKDEKEKDYVAPVGINVVQVYDDNPMSNKAGKERRDKEIVIKDDW